MKPLRILITLSVAANIALAGWWFKSRDAATNPNSTAAESSQTAGKSSGRFGKGSATGDAAASVNSSETSATGAITAWFDIQSADLKQLVRRLREAGCPDETVKDIILAEVNRIYEARSRELWPERYDDNTKFWKTQNNRYNSEQQKKQRESWRKDRELQKEKSALLVELLGVDPEKQQRIEDGYDEFAFDWQERQVSFLPESKREAALKILDDFQDKQQEMYAANAGIHDAQSRAEQRQLEADKLAALAGILSPSELREFELRQSQTASQLTHDLRSLSLSREEYEAIFDAKKKYGDSIYNYGDLGKDGQKQAEENMKAMKAELAASLGADKFKEYERGTDYQYQQLTRLAKKNELPADTAGKVFDYKSTAEDTVKQVRANKDMSNEQRQAALQQIRTETEDTLKKTLGEKAYKSYIKNGGWWINNIAPQQSSGTATRTGNVIIKAQ